MEKNYLTGDVLSDAGSTENEVSSLTYYFDSNNHKNFSTSGANVYSTITGTFGDYPITGIIESVTMFDNMGELSLQKDLNIGFDVIDFIESKGELKNILKRIMEEIYILVSSRNKITKVIFKKDKVNNKINGDIYISDKTTGSLIDLNNDINEIIFNETQQRFNPNERLEILNLFDIKLFDIKNGIKL